MVVNNYVDTKVIVWTRTHFDNEESSTIEVYKDNKLIYENGKN